MAPEPTSVTTEELLAHAGWVRALAARLVRDPHAAEDVAQDAWLAALRRPPRGDRPLEPWLRTVLANLARRRARDAGRGPGHEPPAAPDPPPDELLAQLELQSELAREVARLPEPCRGVVLRRYYRGESCAVIARRTRRPAATVRSQLKRGLDLLRERMDDRFDGDRRARSRAMLFLATGATGARSAALAPLVLHGAWIVKESTRLVAAASALALAVGSVAGVRALLVTDGEQSEDAAPAPIARETPGEIVESAPPEGAPATAPDERTALAPSVEPRSATEEPAPALPPAHLLVARLVDERRTGLQGARLEGSSSSRRPFALAGPSGEVELGLERTDFTRLSDGTRIVSLAASRRGRATRFFSAELQDEGTTDLGEIELAPGGRVSGRVVDVGGDPIPGAEVLLTGSALGVAPDVGARVGPPVGSGLPSATSGGNGRFLLEGAPCGGARVWARADGTRFSFSEPIDVRADEETGGVELVLVAFEREDTIEGTVLDPDGAPLESGSVFASWRSSFSSTHATTAVRDGRFRFVVVHKEQHDLLAWDDDGRFTPAVARGLLPGAHDVVLRLAPERRFTARVLTRDGTPIAGAWLSTETEDELPLDFGDRARSDAQGLAHPRIPGARFVLAAQADGCERAVAGPWDPESAPELVEIRLELLPGARGRVLIDGEPAAGARVRLMRLRSSPREKLVHRGSPLRMDPRPADAAVADAEGRYALIAEHEGEHAVIASLDGRAPAESKPIELVPRRGAVLEDLHLGSGGAIEGTLTPEPGRAREGLLVTASRGDGDIRSTRTDGDGRYRFELLTPGRWQVSHQEREAPISTTYGNWHEPFEIPWNCEVQEGRTTRHDLDLGDRGRAELAGRLELGGSGAAGWIATLTHEYAAGLMDPARPAELDEDGRFRFSVPPGPYGLRLESPPDDGRALTLETNLALESGTNTWERALPAGRIRGSVRDASARGWPRTHARWHADELSVWSELVPDDAGHFDLGLVPAGPWRIFQLDDSQQAPSWTRLRELDLEPGTTLELELP